MLLVCEEYGCLETSSRGSKSSLITRERTSGSSTGLRASVGSISTGRSEPRGERKGHRPGPRSVKELARLRQLRS